MKRDSFIFYRSFAEAMTGLDDKTAGQFIKAVARYALDGETPKASGIIQTMLALVRPQIDANNRKYENGCKGGKYGHLGGRPPKETPTKPQGNPKETPNDNDNENENASYAGVHADVRLCAEKAKTNSALRNRALAAGVADFDASVDDFADYLLSVGSAVATQQEFAARYLANINKRIKPKNKPKPLDDTELEAARALFPKANAKALTLLTDSVLPALQEQHGDAALDELRKLAAKVNTVSEVWIMIRNNDKG